MTQLHTTSTKRKIDELHDLGFCILRNQLSTSLIAACKDAFWPGINNYINDHRHKEANRGINRHCIPMPFEPPCFIPDFFFDVDVLSIIKGSMGDRVVADQWHCDVPLPGAGYQGIHVDFHNPLFNEVPDLPLPCYALVISFGLVRITLKNAPIEIAPRTHKMARKEALRAVESSEIAMYPIHMEIGDVLIRHPWTLHRGTPNNSSKPRPLISIRYVRRWYADDSRDVNAIPMAIFKSLTLEQQNMMRFPVA